MLKSPLPDSDEYFQTLDALGCGPEFLQDGTNRSKGGPSSPSFRPLLGRPVSNPMSLAWAGVVLHGHGVMPR